tara:strand:+ start:309 stop:623 length:315 start_codon:yes stop_codon:yes gene_type:complete
MANQETPLDAVVVNGASGWYDLSDDSSLIVYFVGAGTAAGSCYIDLKDPDDNAIRIHTEAFAGDGTKGVQLDGKKGLYHQFRVGVEARTGGNFTASFRSSRDPR